MSRFWPERENLEIFQWAFGLHTRKWPPLTYQGQKTHQTQVHLWVSSDLPQLKGMTGSQHCSTNDCSPDNQSRPTRVNITNWFTSGSLDWNFFISGPCFGMAEIWGDQKMHLLTNPLSLICTVGGGGYWWGLVWSPKPHWKFGRLPSQAKIWKLP